MARESMTSRERWLATLRRETPDRVPMDYWGTTEATEKVMRYLGVPTYEAMCDRLHVDRVVTVAGRYVGPQLEPETDVFGVRHREIRYATGTYSEACSSPLAGYRSVDEIRAHYRWPDPDWWDYSHIGEQAEANRDRPIRGGGSEPFLRYAMLRGLEQAMMDLVDNPEIAHYCLARLFDLAYEDTLRIYEAAPGRVMITYVAEDMGSQEGLMFSPRQIREFFVPGMVRMVALAHDAGAWVFHHNDGAVRPIIPTMIDAGIDVLNPVQWRCRGMERDGLKRDFGDALIFHGGVDNQYTLARGTTAEVRDEVAANLSILGKGGGYILAPCHNIQAVSPAENIIAMYEAGREMGWR